MGKVKIKNQGIQTKTEYFEDIKEMIEVCRINALDAISHFFDLLDIDKEDVSQNAN